MLSYWIVISPKYYYTAYYVIIAILTLICIMQYSKYDEKRVLYSNKNTRSIPALILMVILVFFIGLRPPSAYFLDMLNYYDIYNSLQNNSSNYSFDWNATNLIFNNLFKYLAANRYQIIVFFFIIACIYILCIYFSIKKIFPNDIFYAFVIYLGAFSTFSYGVNGIKAGAAASIFLLAFAYYKKPLIVALICFISLGFHHAMLIPILGFALAYFIKDPKWYFAGWIICVLLAATHLTIFQDIFASFSDNKGSEYLLAGEDLWGGKSGFRWDFILYGLPPIAIGWWMIYKKQIYDRLYQILLCTYMTANAVWMLCMYVPYNNRIAYLSWFMLPIVTMYPFFKLKIQENQYKILNRITIIYMAFSLFMNL